MDSYNGYTEAERMKKLRASYKVFPGRTHPLYRGACQICGDSSHPVEPHTEDYAEPYRWENPAEYAVCKVCHGRLHKRFKNPTGWSAYKSHVKRGGYGADLGHDPKLACEVRQLASSLEHGKEIALPLLRPFVVTDLWWDVMTVDPASLTSPSARPR